MCLSGSEHDNVATDGSTQPLLRLRALAALHQRGRALRRLELAECRSRPQVHGWGSGCLTHRLATAEKSRQCNCDVAGPFRFLDERSDAIRIDVQIQALATFVVHRHLFHRAAYLTRARVHDSAAKHARALRVRCKHFWPASELLLRRAVALLHVAVFRRRARDFHLRRLRRTFLRAWRYVVHCAHVAALFVLCAGCLLSPQLERRSPHREQAAERLPRAAERVSVF
mmetsp:Transcript_10600/g.23980  ORF Transcript_10600/g.23980 Transcript_10600/m.23980 type:complete len:227 (+) Transcript_10600:1244-1924(+)